MAPGGEPGIGHIDIRAMRFLATVLKRRSVTVAGKAMGLSQPAASRLLAQIRRALGGDPLLVRSGSGGYVLTARAANIAPRVAEALAAAERLFAADRFDPATSSRSFRIATTDYGAAVVLSRVVHDLDAQAPGVSVVVVPWAAGTLDDMEHGRVDLALYIDLPLPAGFRHLDLFEEHHACLVRRGHPVLRHRDRQGRIDPARLAALPRVISLYPDQTELAADDPLAEFGAAHTSGEIKTPYLLAGPLLVSRSDRQLCTTQRMAELMASMVDLEIVPLPEGERFVYRAIWHERAEHEPGHAWLVQRLGALVSMQHASSG